MSFILPAVEVSEIIAWDDFFGARRRGGSFTTQYYRYPSQAHFDDHNFVPSGGPVAAIKFSGPTAKWLLDPEADALYTRNKNLILRGLQGQLTAQEQADMEGLEALAPLISTATYSNG